MLKKFIFVVLILLFSVSIAQAAIDIVYPEKNNIAVTSSSITFRGNVDYGSKLKINSQEVKLWNGNFFVEVIPLNIGKNEIIFKSEKEGSIESLIYYVTRKEIKNISSPPIVTYIKNSDEKILYSKTNKDNATVRPIPSVNSKRIVDLPKGVVLYLEGKKGDFYKISESSDEGEFWIHKSNLEVPVELNSKIIPKLRKITVSSDELYNYTKFHLSFPVVFKTEQKDNSVELTMFSVPDIETNKPNYKYIFKYDKYILPYDCYYEGNILVYRIAKIPVIKNENKPLKGINIFVDAGHGGVEKGAVGPTRINEKDINLSIAKYLADLLTQAGANVTLSRKDDRKIPLYERVKMAKDNNSFISISIHNNSLPDGKNPYSNHGSEVYYYNDNAKLLAEIISYNLSDNLNTKNGGARRASFALTRSSNPISVLVEVAYMIYPPEYILLQNEQFQKNAAKSIKNSIEKYILMLKK